MFCKIYLLHLFINDCKALLTLLFVFYGILTCVGYSMANPFLYKNLVLFQTIQFSMST